MIRLMSGVVKTEGLVVGCPLGMVDKEGQFDGFDEGSGFPFEVFSSVGRDWRGTPVPATWRGQRRGLN